MMLLPRMLVSAMSDDPSVAATMFTTNSGAEVPKATIVRPITKSEIFRRLAKPDAPLMSHSAEIVSKAKPLINRK